MHTLKQSIKALIDAGHVSQDSLDEVKEDNKKLAKQVSDYQQNYIRIDGKN